MITLELLILLIITSLSSILFTKKMYLFLERKNIFDIPNERSNHAKPTPVGGGIIVIIWLIISYTILLFITESQYFIMYNILIVASFLSFVSLIDDLKKISAYFRLITQTLAAIIGISLFPPNTKIFNFLPEIIEKIFLIFCLIWFTNLYNFMDGIDGMTSAETLHLSFCFIILFLISNPISSEIYYFSLLLIASMTGFVLYNLHPARIFLGDVGSIPLGFLIGWILILVAKQGYLYFSLISPLYYLIDSTYTLVRRILRRENVFQAHSEHFFQKAVRSGKKHSEVVRTVAIINILLTLIAISSIEYGIISLIMAFIVVLFGIYHLIGDNKNILRENSVEI